MADEYLWLNGKPCRDLISQGRQIIVIVHGAYLFVRRIDLPDSRRGSGNGGGGFSLRFSFCRSATCAFLPGDGPRTFGFSIAIEA